jgi:hypothetical protein
MGIECATRAARSAPVERSRMCNSGLHSAVRTQNSRFDERSRVRRIEFDRRTTAARTQLRSNAGPAAKPSLTSRGAGVRMLLDPSACALVRITLDLSGVDRRQRASMDVSRRQPMSTKSMVGIS